MGRIYSYHFLNDIADRATVGTPSIALADLLEVSRNGIGMQAGTYANETVACMITEYQRRSSNTNTASVNKYIIAVSNIPTVSNRTVVYEFGPLVEAGDTYRFEQNFLVGAQYVAQALDTATDVRNNVKTQIDGTTWSGFTTTTSSISTNRLQVVYSTPFSSLSTFIVFGVKYLFQAGYYVEIAGKGDYLILNSNSYTGFPTLPSMSGTYAFGDLVRMPSGIIPFINNPNYIQDSYGTTVLVPTNVTGVPTASSLGAGRYVYDELSAVLTFAEPLQPGEYIKMLYK